MIRTCACGALFTPHDQCQHDCDECERDYDARTQARLDAMEEIECGEAEADWQEQEIELEEAA